MSDGGYVFPEKSSTVYAAVIPIRLEEVDKSPNARKLAHAAAKRAATLIMQTWLAHPGTYDVDITVKMEQVL